MGYISTKSLALRVIVIPSSVPHPSLPPQIISIDTMASKASSLPETPGDKDSARTKISEATSGSDVDNQSSASTNPKAPERRKPQEKGKRKRSPTEEDERDKVESDSEGEDAPDVSGLS
jgi:hypothetical protein